MRVRAIVIANAADADCGFVGERFRHHGFAFTEAHRGQRNALLWLCAFRALALPLLAWLVGYIIKGPISAGDGVGTAEWLLLFLGAVIVADIALYWRIRLAHQIGEAVLRPP